MGMESGEYYNTLYPDLLLKIEGCRQRLKREEAMFRKVGFSAYIGSHLDPKGMAKSEGRYWPIDEEDGKKGVVDLEGKKEAFMELLKEVQNNKSPK